MQNKSESGHIPVLTLSFRMILGVVFLYASIDKIRFPAEFAISVQNYDMVPVILTNLVALILPWFEFICGLFLVIGLFQRESAGICALLVTVFMIGITAAMIRGLDIDCGCYGMDTQIGWNRVFEDLGLLVMALYVVFFPNSPLAVDKVIHRIFS